MKTWVHFLLAMVCFSALGAEPRLFRWNDAEKKYVEIETATKIEKKVYLMVIENANGTYTRSWVTRQSYDVIVPGSFVEGERLRKTGVWAKTWYQLGKELAWFPVIPKTTPHLWRYSEPFGKTYLSEPGDWWRWNGMDLPDDASRNVVALPPWNDLIPGLEPEVLPPPRQPEPKPVIIRREVTPMPTRPVVPAPKPEPIMVPLPRPEARPTPIPQPDPTPITPPVPEPTPTIEKDGSVTCEIEVNPPTAYVGEVVILSMVTSGPVTSAMLDGAAVDFPKVLRSKTAEAPGRFLVQGTVWSKGGRNTCARAFEVLKR